MGLLAALAILLALNMVVVVLRFAYGRESLFGFAELLLMREERNVPTWFASILLAISSVLLFFGGITARARRERLWGFWFAYSALFGLLSMDETATLHERLPFVGSSFLDPTGALAFPWVIAGGIITFAIFLASIRWLLVLPRPTAIRFFTAGAVFVGGAIGVEMISAAIYDATGTLHTPTYYVVASIEEVMEKLGVILFIRALLLQLEAWEAQITFAPS